MIPVLSVCASLAHAPSLWAATTRAGETLYETHCAECHSKGSGEAPARSALEAMSVDAILRAMDAGVMQAQASALSAAEKAELAAHLGKEQTAATPRFSCQRAPDSDHPAAQALSSTAPWQSWGHSPGNRRRVPAQHTAIHAGNIQQLQLDWVHAIPEGTRSRSQPALDSASLYFGTQHGVLHALDRESGCERWRFQADAEVRIAPALAHAAGQPVLVVADFSGVVYLLDRRSGELLWRRAVADHAKATITGSPVVHEDRIFVPLSSLEVIAAVNPEYPCCSFRGSVVALDLEDGKELWRRHSIPSEPRRIGRNRGDLSDHLAPSGAPIWSAPTVDGERNRIYVGTGENYSAPASPGSDSILAIDSESGEILWQFQTLQDDAWNAACLVGPGNNCPEPSGPDYDFGAPPVLTTSSEGQSILIAGQKSGSVYALDPQHDGKLLWHRRLGHGGFNGGVHWGLAATQDLVVVPISDSPSNENSDKTVLRPGISALRISDGEVLWQHRFRHRPCDAHDYRCYPSLSAAPTIAGDLVFAGGLDGILRAFDLHTGEQLWRFDTVRSYRSVDGVQGFGGSIDSGGPVIDGEQMFITSGYDKFGEIPGNVVLSFRLRTAETTRPSGAQ